MQSELLDYFRNDHAGRTTTWQDLLDQAEEIYQGGALGIRRFTQGNAQYYYGGRLSKSLQHSLPPCLPYP